ncbi:hypothetical protein F7R02_26130, partial [Xanthomonas cissicola]
EPLRAVIGHELTHRMQIERPDLYRELATAIAAAGVDQERWQALIRPGFRRHSRPSLRVAPFKLYRGQVAS